MCLVPFVVEEKSVPSRVKGNIVSVKQKLQLTLKRSQALAPGVALLTLDLPGDVAAACRPGQFFNIQPLPSTAPLLRRPISICDVRPDTGELDLLVQVVGEGTRLVTSHQAGDTLDAVGPLGSTFTADPARPSVMIAGGVGVAPLYYLTQSLIRQAEADSRASEAASRASGTDSRASGTGAPAPITFCYGARTAAGFVLLEKLRHPSVRLVLTTEDGSGGAKGYVTEHAAPFLTPEAQVFVCGPAPMMNAALGLLRARGLEGQISLENRMGCGVGACQGCVVPSRRGMIRVCCDGPVVPSEWLDAVYHE